MRLRRNSLPFAGIGTSGGSRRNCVQLSIGPAWKQTKFVPRITGWSVISFSSWGLWFLVIKGSRGGAELLAQGRSPRREGAAMLTASHGVRDNAHASCAHDLELD